MCDFLRLPVLVCWCYYYCAYENCFRPKSRQRYIASFEPQPVGKSFHCGVWRYNLEWKGPTISGLFENKLQHFGEYESFTYNCSVPSTEQLTVVRDLRVINKCAIITMQFCLRAGVRSALGRFWISLTEIICCFWLILNASKRDTVQWHSSRLANLWTEFEAALDASNNELFC